VTTDEKTLQLDALELAVQRLNKRKAELPERVRSARKAGASWTDISRAMNVSRQAVWV
jgi:hypothetical protein